MPGEIARSSLPWLASDEPPPVEVDGHGDASPFVIICDHAGRRVPRALGDLGLAESDRSRHIAWDIGAGEVARRLGAALDAVVFRQTYSRLVIDCNRPLDAVDSIVTASDQTVIQGNAVLSSADVDRRVQSIFLPYHARIRAELDRRQALGRATLLIAVHSFTPVMSAHHRPWHAGVLCLRDERLARPLERLLRRETGLVVGWNEPYEASAASDFSIVEHGERRGIAYVELEIRQDLIDDVDGQDDWCARLARLLPLAAAEMAR